MLDFSPEKMIFIFLIVMIVLGPEKLPEVSRKIGKAMGELRKLSGGFREEMNKAVHEATSDSGSAGGSSAAGTAAPNEIAPTPTAEPTAASPSADSSGN